MIDFTVQTVSKTEQGFTFLELMIVATIIGILSAIAIPSYHTYLTRSQATDALMLTADVRQAVAKYYFYTGEFPHDNFATGVSKDITGKYVQSVTVEDGAIQVLFSDLSQQLAGKYISLRPVIVRNQPTAPIYFACGNSELASDKQAIQAIIGNNRTDVDEEYLPSACR